MKVADLRKVLAMLPDDADVEIGWYQEDYLDYELNHRIEILVEVRGVPKVLLCAGKPYSEAISRIIGEAAASALKEGLLEPSEESLADSPALYPKPSRVITGGYVPWNKKGRRYGG